MSEKTVYPKPPRPGRDRSGLRYRVRYSQMAVDGGGTASWVGYHRTRTGARIAAWWGQNMTTWGGVVTITDREDGSRDDGRQV